jgi:SAM-dependent methyltransferase
MGQSDQVTYHKRDFWAEENPKYREPHHRLQKAARIVNRLAGDRNCRLLDVGCGPATLRGSLRPNIEYFGIDIAISQPAPYLAEVDILAHPIQFGAEPFGIVVAQGLFEYLGEHQDAKLAEIASLITPGGVFLCSYVNFAHRNPYMYWPYSNVRSPEAFEASLARYFKIQRRIPTAHNWNGSEPNRRWIRALNMRFDRNLPGVTRRLAVEYFFVSAPRELKLTAT